MNKLILAIAFSLVTTTLTAPAAHTDTITFIITNPLQGTGPPGGVTSTTTPPLQLPAQIPD